MLSLDEHDLIVTKGAPGRVAAVVKKGSWPAAVASKLANEGRRPRKVSIAGGLMVGYIIAAILPSLVLFISSFNKWQDGSIGAEPVHYVLLAISLTIIIMGLGVLVNTPGYYGGDPGARRNLIWAMAITIPVWFIIGALLVLHLVLEVIPITFLVLTTRHDSKVYFNAA